MPTNFILIAPHAAASMVMEDITELTLEDLCRACATQADIILELVSEGVIDNADMQQSVPQTQWRFTGLHLHRAKVAMRLHRDLGVNFAGAALALDLMDELDILRTKIRVSAI
jgi:chaperone modulatory protein CbpM